MFSQIIFLIALVTAIFFFAKNSKKIIRNIKLGTAIGKPDKKAKRWLMMVRVALGQSKMGTKPVAAILHLIVYAGFIIINLEVLEIILDGVFGTHRIFSFLGSFYSFLIGFFEILALLVLVAVFIFLIRRVILKLKRFSGVEMVEWPKRDAIYILLIEVVLMTAFLFMNASDYKLQTLKIDHYITAGAFPISQFLIPILPASANSLFLLERTCWWVHILGILAFLNYLPFSKHLHIILAFPNTWYAKLAPKGELNTLENVKNEVMAMLNPSYIPTENSSTRFGAKDVEDLNQIQLLNAYSCTECGRCTSVCPANITGKLLSPRKIMMDTRDRLEEVGKQIDLGKQINESKTLLDGYISREEIWACTTCNACVEACPINIDPLSIIIDLRRYAIMEESNAANSINNMFGNIENNGAPWKYASADRFNWATKS